MLRTRRCRSPGRYLDRLLLTNSDKPCWCILTPASEHEPLTPSLINVSGFCVKHWQSKVRAVRLTQCGGDVGQATSQHFVRLKTKGVLYS